MGREAEYKYALQDREDVVAARADERRKVLDEVLTLIKVHRGSIRDGDTAAQVTLHLLNAVELLNTEIHHFRTLAGKKEK